jgi:hypothetical protein
MRTIFEESEVIHYDGDTDDIIHENEGHCNEMNDESDDNSTYNARSELQSLANLRWE